MERYIFSPAAFRRRFLPRLLLLLAPSFLLDGFIVYRGVLSGDGGGMGAALLANALLWKGLTLLWYAGQRRIYAGSWIERQGGVWTYHRKLLDFADGNYDNITALEYVWEQVEAVERRGQDLLLRGDKVQRWVREDGSEGKARRVGRVQIPACFEGMETLAQVLERSRAE